MPQGTPVSASPSAAAVRAATHRALAARDRLLQDYPRWEEWRRQARALKAEAVSRLEELLEQLSRAVTAWGGRVLWARDAAEARGLIVNLARQHGVEAVVKSKSMTTEEIGLNPALAAAGLKVRETDLGEFIVQLAGHPPAHITAPAMHLDRHQIAALFRDHLGMATAADPEVLARSAAAYLQDSFARAQMGITGVNFAAADGTLVLLENENNLRLTANLPRVHLALMGVEKVIPSLAQAEVLLRLLPASATGQRLTALVHFLRGLKPQPQGHQAFYLVLLDNGRRRLAAQAELAEALYCLRCGACLNTCPVFQMGGAHVYARVYPGPIGILLAPFLAPTGDLADLCTQCGACSIICPVQIQLAEKIRLLRADSPRFRRVRALSGAAGLVLARPALYRALSPWLRPLAREFSGFLAGDPLSPYLAPESFQQRRSAAPWRRRETSAPCPGVGPMGVPAPPPIPGSDDGSQAGELAARLAEVGGRLYCVSGPGALAQLLAELGSPLWLEDHPRLRPLINRVTGLGAAPRLGSPQETPAGQVAVTAGLGAVPETGSVLVSGTGPTTRLSLQVPRQVVVVPRDRARLSLAQALELSAREGPVTWLTGPSRTADIEKVLVVGAQGPRELFVILYDGEE